MNEFKVEYPELKYHATKQDVTETELRLTKEIEETRKEIKEIDAKLTKEIEQSKEFRADVNKRFDETLKRLDRFMFWSLGLVMASTALIIKILG